MVYWVDHLQFLLVIAIKALAPGSVTASRAGAWSQRRWYEGLHLQATFCQGERRRWTSMLLALSVLLHQSLTFFPIFSIMWSTAQVPGFFLFIQSGASRSWRETMKWWRNFLCHRFLSFGLFFARSENSFTTKGGDERNYALVIEDPLD